MQTYLKSEVWQKQLVDRDVLLILQSIKYFKKPLISHACYFQLITDTMFRNTPISLPILLSYSIFSGLIWDMIFVFIAS